VTDQWETEEFKRGYRAAQLERLGPRGIPRSRLLPGAQYEFRDGHFWSAVAYERDVTVNLRCLQMLRTTGRSDRELDPLEAEVNDELRVARGTVDEILKEGNGYACVVEAMRASPQRPPAVREYAIFTEAVEEDPRRAIPDWPAREDLGGADFGDRWGLENPLRRWESSRWRISWIEETEEAYAIEHMDDEPWTSQFGRVWILGKLPSFASARQALLDPQLRAMDERNSLIVAAKAVADAIRSEEPGDPV
jgi:hypothetical protein